MESFRSGASFAALYSFSLATRVRDRCVLVFEEVARTRGDRSLVELDEAPMVGDKRELRSASTDVRFLGAATGQ